MLLRFSLDQWHAMARATFASRVLALIRHAHPDVAVDGARLAPVLAQQMDRAAAHGLLDERSAARFAYAGWLLGFDFDTRIPAVAQVLAEPGLSADRRSGFLMDFARAAFGAVAKA